MYQGRPQGVSGLNAVVSWPPEEWGRDPAGFALFGVLGLAAVVLVHEIAEVIVILNGLRAARTRKEQIV